MTETLCTLALAKIKGLKLSQTVYLYRRAGTAAAIIEHSRDLQSLFEEELSPEIGKRLQEGLPEALEKAKQEIEFLHAHQIQCLCLNNENYPKRLKHCDDPPLILFYMGTADLESPRILCMVGTRKCTDYGRDLCASFLSELKELCPDVIVVSGLAYGIDINAHRNALSNGLMTVGVLAHGLDRIYPSMHRTTAKEMIAHGGLLTEFMSGTIPEKLNFIRRNRIIAGISDACIVVESSSKGGSLITAALAQDYNRDVFAFPGRVGDTTSLGCNNLIKENKAGLITSAHDFAEAMQWTTKSAKPIQQELFNDLNPDEERVVSLLKNADGKHLNQLVVETNIPVQTLMDILFNLELKGKVKAMAGGRYRIPLP